MHPAMHPTNNLLSRSHDLTFALPYLFVGFAQIDAMVVAAPAAAVMVRCGARLGNTRRYRQMGATVAPSSSLHSHRLYRSSFQARSVIAIVCNWVGGGD